MVLTDGRSQDDVEDAAMEARAQNIVLFAVGVGNEITRAELVSMANKPASTYVLHVEDYNSISSIWNLMEQKLCEGELRFGTFCFFLTVLALKGFTFGVCRGHTCTQMHLSGHVYIMCATVCYRI